MWRRTILRPDPLRPRRAAELNNDMIEGNPLQLASPAPTGRVAPEGP